MTLTAINDNLEGINTSLAVLAGCIVGLEKFINRWGVLILAGAITFTGASPKIIDAVLKTLQHSGG